MAPALNFLRLVSICATLHFVALASAAPISLADTRSSVVLEDLTVALEKFVLETRNGRDEAASGSKLVFPGIANILLGAFTGDVRRIVESGAFHFLSESARNQAIAVYKNLLNVDRIRPTTKKPPKTTTEEPEPETTAATTPNSEADPDESEDKAAAATITESNPVSNANTGETEAEEGDTIVARFEQALLPYLPENPQDVVLEELPNFV